MHLEVEWVYMFKVILKKLPIIKFWFHHKILQQRIKTTEQQLQLSIKMIEICNEKYLSLRTEDSRLSTNCYNGLISITSYGIRVQTVHHTILSLLCQSVLPKKIILWLAEDEFNLAELPKSLVALQQYGLEIVFCQDIRSYKKLIPTLKTYPNTTIVTFDDDIIYPVDHLEKLLVTHKQFPEVVICHRAHRIIKDEQGQVVDYLKWQFDVAEHLPAKDIFPVGIGGVLYPANCFDEEVLNDTAFMNLAPSADDLWFKTMTIKHGTLAKVIDNPMPYLDYLQIPLTQAQSLWQNNQANNSVQLQAILKAYPQVEL